MTGLPSVIALRGGRGRTRRALALALLVSLALPGPGCVFRRVEVEPVVAREGVVIQTPVKAHLKDGSTVVYERGARVAGGALIGAGRRFDLALAPQGEVRELPLSEVLALESFRGAVETTESALGTLGVVAGLAALPFLAVAIFGSCPTVYTETGGAARLEAETFSYSIVPLFEGRDLDRLVGQPDAAGRLRLEVRNEALETHYINHMQVLALEHAPDEIALPDQHGRPLVVGDLRPVARVHDRRGRDARALLGAADARAWRTPPEVLAAAGEGDLDDWLDLEIDAPPGAEELALVFRLRNSLLNTILFYDEMLGAAGPRAIDWLGRDLEQIGEAVAMGRWLKQRAGLRVELWQDGRFVPQARVPDSGPIAWRDVAATLRVPPGARALRLRLSFVADAFHIDSLALAARVRRPEARLVPAARVTQADGRPVEAALEELVAADQRYLVTRPGQRFFATFETGAAPPGRARTFLLSSQGYYTEWVRGDWLRAAGDGRRFEPGDQALVAALRKWRRVRREFEREFQRRRIPVA